MRHKSLQNKVTAGRGTLPAVIFICTLCWAITYWLCPPSSSIPSISDASALWQLLYSFQLPLWTEQLICYLIYAGIGYFLIELNNRFAIIRMRASVQTAIYFLFVTICPEMHILHVGIVASFAFVISLYFLFDSYQRIQSSTILFNSFALLGIGSLLFPQLTFLIIPWLIGAYRFQSLTLRSFFAAMLGWWFPYWFLLGHAFFYGEMELFYASFRTLATFGRLFDFAALHLWQFATLAYLLLLYIVSMSHCIVSGFEDKIRTRAYLQFLILLTCFLFIYLILQPVFCNDVLPLLMITISILSGHFFILTHSKVSNLFFLISTALLVFLFAFNLWTLL